MNLSVRTATKWLVWPFGHSVQQNLEVKKRRMIKKTDFYWRYPGTKPEVSWLGRWKNPMGPIMQKLCGRQLRHLVSCATEAPLFQKTVLLKLRVISPAFSSTTSWLLTWHHHITHLHNLCLTASLELKNWFCTATQLLLAVLALACVNWPMRDVWVFERDGS